MAFRVGQQVCCIAKSGWYIYGTAMATDGPIVGDILKISEIEADGFLVFEGDDDCSYDPRDFRPLVSTNIDVFKAILANPHKQLETVE